MIKYVRLFCCISLFGLVINCFAIKVDDGKKSLKKETSWHFYGLHHKTNNSQKIIKKTDKPLTDDEAIESVAAIKRKYKAAIDRAIIQPTLANMVEAQKMHLTISKLSANFQARWNESYLMNMNQFVEVNSPVTSYGIQEQSQAKDRDFKKSIAAFNESGGLLYFYKSTCSYCKQFTPIIKNFIRLNKINLKAISCDGQASPDFPDSKLANAATCQKFNITKTPSVVAIKPKTNQQYFLSIGLVSHEILKNNMLKLISEQGDFNAS